MSHHARRCPLCGQQFATRQGFEQHYQRIHHQLSRFACPGCGAVFETRGALIDHARTLHHRWA
jgi:uncharacterized C2H2 Zn-finger protein